MNTTKRMYLSALCRFDGASALGCGDAVAAAAALAFSMYVAFTDGERRARCLLLVGVDGVRRRATDGARSHMSIRRSRNAS